jgi:uncharacterized membrane protein YedE/YeeE
MKILLLTVVIVIYTILGITFQNYEIIEHPALWSLFGSFFGAIITMIIIMFNEE